VSKEAEAHFTGSCLPISGAHYKNQTPIASRNRKKIANGAFFPAAKPHSILFFR